MQLQLTLSSRLKEGMCFSGVEIAQISNLVKCHCRHGETLVWQRCFVVEIKLLINSSTVSMMLVSVGQMAQY